MFKASGTSNRREDLLEQARRERQQREEKRRFEHVSIVVQKFVKGRLESNRQTKTHVDTLRSRLSDLDNISTLLAAQTQSQEFTPPWNTVHQLLRSLLFITRKERWYGISAPSSMAFSTLPLVLGTATWVKKLHITGEENQRTLLEFGRLCLFALHSLTVYRTSKFLQGTMTIPRNFMIDNDILRKEKENGCASNELTSVLLHIFLNEKKENLNSLGKKFCERAKALGCLRSCLINLVPFHLSEDQLLEEGTSSVLNDFRFLTLRCFVLANIFSMPTSSHRLHGHKMAQESVGETICTPSPTYVLYFLSIPGLMEALEMNNDWIARFLDLATGHTFLRELFHIMSSVDRISLDRETIEHVVSGLFPCTTKLSSKENFRLSCCRLREQEINKKEAAWGLTTFVIGNIMRIINGFLHALSPPLDEETQTTLSSMLEKFSKVIPELPTSLWVSGSPVVWTSEGASYTPVSLPGMSSRQLRLLADKHIVKCIARVALDINVNHISEERNKAMSTQNLKEESDDEEIPTQSWWSSLHNSGSSDPSSYLYGLAPSSSSDNRRNTAGTKPGFFSSLTQKISTFFSGTNENVSAKSAIVNREKTGRGNGLIETTQSARQYAEAGAATSKPVTKPKKSILSNKVFVNFSVYCACLLECSGTQTKKSKTQSGGTILKSENILSTLAFTPSLDSVRKLWYTLIGETNVEQFIKKSGYACLCEFNKDNVQFSTIYLFAAAFSQLLMVTDDFELYEKSFPLPRTELAIAINTLKLLLAHAYGYTGGKYRNSDTTLIEAQQTRAWKALEKASLSLLTELYQRQCRRKLTRRRVWRVDCSNDDVLTHRLLGLAPFMVPFRKRLEIYNERRVALKRETQSYVGPPTRIIVRRDALFDTTYRELQRLTPSQLKGRMDIKFVNEYGVTEEGIDAGGLFKELWTQFSDVVFNPSYGLFKETPDHLLYPSPTAFSLGHGDVLTVYEIIGRVVGKALYEGIVIQPQFAHFFLAKILGNPVHLHHLPSLDPELYKNLIFIKNYEGDIRDLCLTFTVPQEDAELLGQSGTGEYCLVPCGDQKEVTNQNKLLYIHLVANARLNLSTARQTEAFRKGLYSVVPQELLKTFSEPEIQVLISGAHKGIDVEDLKNNTKYFGHYSSRSKPVKLFWEIVSEYSDTEKAALLQFVTACSRPPPLGFKELQPPFAIQPISSRDKPLPSASTCFNVLKLPDYRSKSEMKKKLNTAIHSASGFETE